MLEKKITFNEYKEALSLVFNYKKQNKSESKRLDQQIPKGRAIDLSGKISDSMLKVLVAYYKNIYQLEIKRADLSQMYVNLLAAIDYNLLQQYRGIGKLRILKLQKIIEYNLQQLD